ncbi:hypothetical protein ACOBV8_18795 (plasmid) [Pseudoalteromonas espejiana]
MAFSIGLNNQSIANKDMQGLNMVEFNAVSRAFIKDKVNTLCTLLDECVAKSNQRCNWLSVNQR